MNILFVGGGSGGHFYPCIEFIKYCIKKGDNCYFIGGINKYEEKKKNLIPCNYKFYEFNGFNNTFKSGIKLIKSYLKNKKAGCLYVALVDYGRYDLKYLSDYDGTSIDAIRVCFKKHEKCRFF